MPLVSSDPVDYGDDEVTREIDETLTADIDAWAKEVANHVKEYEASEE
jgi:hypothetical protein